ncbi:uncharacterized protein LOC107865699 [Capsicum annuum]|uniref:uncharacterized protein LOC107865699 n=1 Tax=Capsicum annuum TaxID=4072 RepID=UPI001FB08B0C|nr:uncharacterized protein LOC107865699 [Capsicum annuum]
MPVGDSSDWPPPGWTEDVKVTNGRKIKYYTNVETGKNFYSKKEVTRYMNTKETCHDVTQAMNDQDKSCSENNVSQMNNQDKSCSEKNARQMNNQDKSCSGKNIGQMNNQDKSCSENNVSQTVGEPNNAHEWLPLGWIVELKTRKSGSHAGTTYKVYIEPSTGNKFYSKPEVSKYLKTMEQNNIAEGQIHGNGEVSSSNQKIPEDSKSIKGGGQSRKSKRQKSDTDQAVHGVEEESVSKKKASQDSEDVGEQRRISNRKKSGTNRRSTKTSSHGAGEDFPLNEKTSLGSKENSEQSPLSKRQKPGSDSPSAKSVSSVAGDSDSVDEFPPGWKKEFIIQENDRGTRKDLVYTDPVHGYKFRSKEEVLCYLQTGDASRCARRPAKRNVASTTKDDSPLTDDASLKKSVCFMTGRQLFATDELKGAKSFGTCSPAQQVESSKKQFDCSVSDPNTIISSILAEINENHSIENVIEDADIESVKVGVMHPSAVSTKSDLLPEKQLLENEQEKLRHKAAKKQSRKSKTKESLNLGRRASKRLAGQNPEAEAANLDLGERALPLIVEKSSSPSLSMNVCRQELLQDSDPIPETGNSDQVSLNGEASLDELPPGWKKEIKITKKANGIRKDPLYIDPVHGYVLRSKKDVFRYLQTGDINSCAIRPVKRDKDATMKESSPTAANADSKKLECSVTERQPFAAKESRGRKRSDTCSPEIQAKNSKKQPESRESNANLIVTSSAADIYAKHSDENVIENAGIRDSSADRKVIAAQSDAIKKSSAVSTPPSDLTPEQQLPENEHEKHINKEKLEQSRRSRTKKPITPGRRISKRLVGHSPEPVADLNLGERAFRAVVKKSASLDIPLNVSAQEFSQNIDPALGTGSFDQASLNREASGNEFPPDREREIPIQNIDPTVGSGNSDQASLSRDASGDELSPGLEKEMLAQNKDPTVGTGNSDRASLSRKASGNELSPGLEKEMLARSKDRTVGTGNSDQASLSRKASGNELSPGLEKEMLTQNKNWTVGTGNSDLASLSTKASLEEIPPGWENEILGQKKYPTVGTGISGRVSLSRKLSPDEIPPGWENVIPPGWKNEIPAHASSLGEIPPGWEKEILAYNKVPTIRTGNSDQASLSRKLASADDLPPGWEKEMITRNKVPAVGTGNSLDDIPPGWEKELLFQTKNPKVGTGNSNQSYLSREASMDELPPGWTMEFRMRKNARGKDPYYMNPMHEYVFRSKKDVMRYLQTGDIRSCAVRPTKRDPYSTMKDDSPSNHDTSSKILGCSLTGSQLSATEESKGRKCSATRSLALHAESSNEHHESTVFNLNTSISSTVADITDKHSCENVNEDANIGVSMRSRKMKNSKSSTPVRRVSKRLSRQNQEMVADIDPGERAVVNNSASSGLPLDASGGELAQQPDLATGDSDQPSLRRKASSRDDPLKAVKYLSEGQPFKEQKVVNGLTSEKQNDEIILRGSQPARISFESRKFHSEHQAVKESPTAKPGNEVQDSQYRLLNNSRPVELASGRMVFPVEDQYVSERSTIEQVSEKRDYENRQWQDSQLAEPSWRSVDLNVENQQWQYSQLTPSQRSVDLNVENQQWQYAQLAPSRKSVDLNVENQQWQYSQLAPYSQPAPSRGSVDLNVENRQRQYSQPAPSQGSVDLNVEKQHSQPAPSQRSVDLNVENQQWQESQLAPSQRSVDLNVVNQQWQDSHLAPSQRSVDLNVVNQQWQDSQLAPSQRSVDLNVANQQWQDTQLAEPSQRSVDLNVANQPIREKQTGELVTENQDEQNRRLHAQLASYTFGDYWSDPCLEFAFKTLTGTLPVEENTPFQGSAHQEYNTSYSHADDGCFELPLFNTSSFYMNDVPHHCAPSEEHIVKEQPPINHTFLPNGNNSVPGCSNVVTQNPGLAFFPNGNNSLPGYSNVSQNSGLDPHAKDYQSKFKSQR